MGCYGILQQSYRKPSDRRLNVSHADPDIHEPDDDEVWRELEHLDERNEQQLQDDSELSGGMARRVALARAIALDPMLMLYDEPFTGLDPISLGVIRNLIRRLNDALGATSIVVTHDVQEALEIVDYVYYMSDGKVVAHGTPDEMRAMTEPLVRQFVYGEPDGPVPFQYPSKGYAEDLRMGAGRG